MARIKGIAIGTDLPLEATRDIFHAGMMLVCIQTENFVFLLWQGSTDSPLEATRDIFHASMMQRNKLVYAWWWYCHPFVLHHSGSLLKVKDTFSKVESKRYFQQNALASTF